MDQTPVTLSPSQTEAWLRCPQYMQYKYEGWEPRLLNWAPNRTLGSAIAKGLEIFYMNQDHSDPGQLGWEACEVVMREQYQENDKWTYEGVLKLALKGYKAALANNIAAQETIVAAELPIGPCRPDLITRSKQTGGLIVTDTKVTLELDERYRAKRLSEYNASFQLWQYADVVGAYYGEPVTFVRVQLVILSPRCLALLHPIPVTREGIALWRDSAEWAWAEMAKHAATGHYPPRLTECFGKFGKCAFFDACHDLNRDRSQMNVLYEKTVRLGPDNDI